MLSLGPLAGPTKTLVGQATRDNDSPPSGYQLDLICKASFASPSDCDQLLDAILRRLDSNSANVKWKTLRVISYLCQHGNASIRKELQRKIDRIRACTGFTGSLHPLRGDAPNERVRVAAKEALSALFCTPEPQPSALHARLSHLSGGESLGSLSNETDSVLGTALKSVISTAASLVTNSSSSADQTSLYRPSGSNYQITGMGNPAFQRSDSQPASVLDKMKQVFDPKWRSQSIANPQHYSGLPMGGGPSNRGDFDVKPAALEGSQQRRRGQVGGSWAQHGSETYIPTSSRSQERVLKTVSPDFEARHRQDTPDEYGSLEIRLIDELTAPGGVSAAPSSDQLSTLLSSIDSFDQALIADLLAQKLDEGQSWQTQAKALSVIESLINEGCDEVAEHFASAPECIINLASSNLRAVRVKADKVYGLLGLSNKRPVIRSQESSSRSSLQAPDLLQFPADAGPTVDLLDVNAFGNPSLSQPTTSDPLGFLLQQQSHVSPTDATSFPFISDGSHPKPEPAELSSVPIMDQGYMPISDNTLKPPSQSPNSDFIPTSNSFSFLNDPLQIASFPSSNSGVFRPGNVSEPSNSIVQKSSQPGSAFSFVSQSAAEQNVSAEKPLDPFASAIKTVRKNETTSRDSFSFVQDIIKSSTNSR